MREVGTFPGEEEGSLRDVVVVAGEADPVRRTASHQDALGSGDSSSVDRRRERGQRLALGTRQE